MVSVNWRSAWPPFLTIFVAFRSVLVRVPFRSVPGVARAPRRPVNALDSMCEGARLVRINKHIPALVPALSS